MKVNNPPQLPEVNYDELLKVRGFVNLVRDLKGMVGVSTNNLPAMGKGEDMKININQQLKDKLELNAELLNKTVTETLEAAIRQQYKQLMWQKLCEQEPKLKALQGEILSVKDEGKSFCANDVWQGGYTREGPIFMREGFKSKLHDLVGWRREDHPILGTDEAYRVAFRVLFWDSLPDCRECGCIVIEDFLPGVLDASQRPI